MAYIASAINGLVAFGLHSAKAPAAQDDVRLAHEFDLTLGKIESIGSDGSSSVDECADKFLRVEVLVEKRAGDGRLARRWKKLRLGWSQKAPRNKLDVSINSRS